MQTLTLNVPMAQINRNPDATPRLRGRAWTDRRAAWLRQHPLCCMCEQDGTVKAAQEVDHIQPLCDGGADNETNYQSLCIEHHAEKTAGEVKARHLHRFGA